MNRLAQTKDWPAALVTLRPVAELKPALRNVRLHSDRQLYQTRQSLQDYGWTPAVLVDEEGRIIAGHGRVEAAKREGMSEVPVVVHRRRVGNIELRPSRSTSPRSLRDDSTPATDRLSRLSISCNPASLSA